MRRIYLDYAASTPVDLRVARAMQPYFTEKFGNPGSLHSFGQEAIAAVDRSRESIAKKIGAEFRELIFTGSATEANNLALRGAIKAAREKFTRPRVIISAIEHESVIETARDLERDGVEIIYLPVNRQGIADLDHLKKSLNDQTVIVSVMYANNEIGAIQPVAEIARIIADFKNGRKVEKRKNMPLDKNPYPIYPLFHTDAAQALQFLDCDVQKLGVDLMTLSAHKIYGPKGVGALYIKSGESAKIRQAGAARGKNLQHIAPVIAGGGQEFGVRSGTESVPAIVGFAKAVELIAASRARENKKIEAIKNYFWKAIKKIAPNAELNCVANEKGMVGRIAPAPASLPNILNIYFPGRDAQDLLTRFDLAGLAASSGSACRSRAMESSYVIEALGYAKARAKQSIRFSFGRPTTTADAAAALKIVKNIVVKKNETFPQKHS